MDFSHGTGGRIISDPQEAALVAKSSIRIRSFPAALSSSSVTASGSSQEDPSLDLSTPPCSQLWFRPGMGREQANTALFPHRNRDGVFLIRACSRQTNNYVLSFTSNNKIVHAQIVRVSSRLVTLEARVTSQQSDWVEMSSYNNLLLSNN